jgi:hypothetical protein
VWSILKFKRGKRSENLYKNVHQTNDETLDCIPPGVLVPDFPLLVLYEFVLLLLQSVRLFVREEEEEESASVAELKRRNGTCPIGNNISVRTTKQTHEREAGRIT